MDCPQKTLENMEIPNYHQSSKDQYLQGNDWKHSPILYNATTWTMTESLRKSLDGTYTKLLRYALHIKWQDRIRKTDLYQNLPKVSTRLQQRRLTFAGHCWRSQESAIRPFSDLIFWSVPGGTNKRGQGNYMTYIDTLLKDHAGEKIGKKDHSP